MNMLNSKQCEAFLAVAETGSFELAAERLYVTASAITLRVQNLEKDLGQMLIIRERPCRTTQAGQALLQYLQHRRLLEQNLRQELTGYHPHSNFYQVHIASNADSLATWLLSALQDTLIQDKIVLKLQLEDQSQTHHLLETGQVNACISTQAQAIAGCVADYLGSMTYRMVANPTFVQRWFRQGMHRDSLRVAPAVIYNHKDRLHSDQLEQLYGLTESSYPYHQIPDSTAFADAIFKGIGYGMLPEVQIADRLKDGQLIEILPEAKTEVALYWHHWKQQSVAIEKLGQTLKQQAKHWMNPTDS